MCTKKQIEISSLRFLLLASTLLLFSVSTQAKEILVNHVKLANEVISKLEANYKTSINEGSYWYDNFSGYWGIMGGPARGQIAPGLKLGGVLQSNASNGNTGVFINGRELTYSEVLSIKNAYGVVYRGRFWLNSQGLAGYEGQPAIFNFAKVNNKSFNRRSLFGSTGSDGNCSFYLHPNGTSVTNC
jgi:hypothetical protein